MRNTNAEQMMQNKRNVFINLSNHPSSNWSPEQIAASEAYGEIYDMPFPEISPNDSGVEIDSLCQTFLSAIRQQYGNCDIVVHIVGEMTFTFKMVTLLKREGIICVASTTRRDVEMLPDGAKVSRFKFVRYREY